ncbi:MAG TPA: hypothetical protein H9881_08110 [Candidatus Stackebrandtia excrementipullorum]|nr:hypothetical protein [Candidatus Stackebrandtia excrementipullorum]
MANPWRFAPAGWAWADSAAALVIAVFAVRKGVEAGKGDACCAAPVAVLTGEREVDACEDDCCTQTGKKRS